MIEKINIPLVYDDPPKPNIWRSRQNDFFTIFHTHKKHGVLVPWALRVFEPLLSIHSPNEIKDLDWFIYPVLFNEPYYQIRTLTGLDHVDFGFWRYVSSEVIEALKAKKGWIFIDVALEPLHDHDLRDILTKLDDCSQFPNDRIILNVGSLTHTNHPQVNHLPSWLEAHYCGYLVDRDVGFIYNDLPRNFLMEILFDEYMDEKEIEATPNKRFSLFNARYTKHIAATSILHILDQRNLLKKGHVTGDDLDNFEANFSKLLYSNYSFSQFLKSSTLQNKDDIKHFPEYLEPFLIKSDFNVVVEAYFDSSFITWPFITEKVWRCIGHKKPFILLGQYKSLNKLHLLGYKTFKPYINESYDSEPDDAKRFYLTVKEILKLINMSKKDFESLSGFFNFITDYNEQNFRRRLYGSYSFFLSLSNGHMKSIEYESLND